MINAPPASVFIVLAAVFGVLVIWRRTAKRSTFMDAALWVWVGFLGLATLVRGLEQTPSTPTLPTVRELSTWACGGIAITIAVKWGKIESMRQPAAAWQRFFGMVLLMLSTFLVFGISYFRFDLFSLLIVPVFACLCLVLSFRLSFRGPRYAQDYGIIGTSLIGNAGWRLGKWARRRRAKSAVQ